MIVELLGPPAAGKTSVTHALARRLRDDGVPVKLRLSRRPAEPSTDGSASSSTRTATVRRMARPVHELATLVQAPHAAAEGLRMSSALLDLIPQASVVRTIRIHQYLMRLVAAWRAAEADEAVTIFDQAFAQTVFSLACTARIANSAVLDRALDVVPRPDLLVRVDAPLDVLAQRLQARLDRQGVIERSLERAARYGFADKIVFDRLWTRVRHRGPGTADIESGTAASLDGIASMVLRQTRPAAGRARASAADRSDDLALQHS